MIGQNIEVHYNTTKNAVAKAKLRKYDDFYWKLDIKKKGKVYKLSKTIHLFLKCMVYKRLRKKSVNKI